MFDPRSLANELAVFLKNNYLETKEEQAERLKIVRLSPSIFRAIPKGGS